MTTALTRNEKNELNNDAYWLELAADILKLAHARGTSAAEVGASMETGFSVSVRMGAVETVEYHNDKGIGITVYYGQRRGSASTSDTSKEAIEATVEAACNIARYTGEDPYAGLADKDLMAYDYPNLDLYHPWNITPEQAIELALETETIARAYDKRIINSEGASLSTHQGRSVYGNSHGFIGTYICSRHSLSCALIGQENNHSVMQRDYDYTVARDVSDLQSATVVARRAAERTIRRLNAKRLTTRQVPIIFASEIAGGLLNCFISAIRGGNLYRKSSFLLDHLGKQIFPEHIRIYQMPHLKKGLGSAPFDSEGVVTQELDYISSGILTNYVLSSYSARKLGMQTTGNAGGVHNLFISTSDKDLTQLLKEMHTGLLVTELMGQGINIVTGDYSRGAAGYWVENGIIQYPVEEITIAGNLQEMFSHLITVGNDIEKRGNVYTGSILLESMTVAGE